jgi:O-antigen/teichoic acid export membrane protein
MNVTNRNTTEAGNPGVAARQPQTNSVSKVIRGGVWAAVGRFVGIGAALAAEIVVARQLPLDQFGALAVLSSMVALGSGFAMFGLNGALVRLIGENLAARDPATAARAIKLGGLIALAAGALVAVVGGRVLDLVLPPEVPRQQHLLIASALTMVICAWLQIPAESLRAVGEQRWASFLSGGQIGGPAALLLYALLFTITAMLGWGTYEVAVWLKFASVLVIWPLSCWCLKRAFRSAFDERLAMEGSAPSGARAISAGRMLAICGPLTVVHFLNLAAISLDIVVAGWSLSPDDGAHYAAAKRFAVLVGVPAQIMQMTVVGAIADLYEQRRLGDLERLLRRCAAAAAAVAVMMWLAVVAAGGWGLNLLLGAKFEGAYVPLVVLSFTHVLIASVGCTHFALIMTGRHNFVLFSNAVALAVLLISGPPLAARWGGPGLAGVALFAQILPQLIQWFYVRKSVGIRTHAEFGSDFAAAALGPLRRLTKRNKAFRSAGDEPVSPLEVSAVGSLSSVKGRG